MRLRFSLIVALVFAAAMHLVAPWGGLSAIWRVDPALAQTLLFELRLPRTLLVVTYGLALGATGAAVQAVFANPLASPDITGASSGAALGAVIGGYWLGISSPLLLAGCGAVGALLILGLVLLLAGRNADGGTLLLAGIALSLGAGAATSLALALAPSPFAFYDAFDWLMGNFADRSIGQMLVAAVPCALLLPVLLKLARPLDLLALGDDVTASLGHSPRTLSKWVIILSGLAIGACVSVAGAIGFVGLIAPHVARRLVRHHPGKAIAPAALIGALLLLGADGIVRIIPLDRAIPIGVITSLLGTPLVLWIVLRQRRSLAS